MLMGLVCFVHMPTLILHTENNVCFRLRAGADQRHGGDECVCFYTGLLICSLCVCVCVLTLTSSCESVYVPIVCCFPST